MASVVSAPVLAGQINGGYEDGYGAKAKMHDPYALCLSTDTGSAGTSLLFCDRQNYRIRRVSRKDGQVSFYAGSGLEAFLQGSINNGAFQAVFSICSDPSQPGGYYVGMHECFWCLPTLYFDCCDVIMLTRCISFVRCRRLEQYSIL